MTAGEIREIATQYLRLGDADKALDLLLRVPESEADDFYQNLSLAQAYARTDQLELAKAKMQEVLQDWSGANLAGYTYRFEEYENAQVFRDYASAMKKAGLPATPYDAGERLKADHLKHEDLKSIYGQGGSFREVDTEGPFGQPYELSFKEDGSYLLATKLLPGIEFSGTWQLKGDQVCTRSPMYYRGFEICTDLYWDRERSSEDRQRFIRVDQLGVSKFAIERIEE